MVVGAIHNGNKQVTVLPVFPAAFTRCYGGVRCCVYERHAERIEFVFPALELCAANQYRQFEHQH